MDKLFNIQTLRSTPNPQQLVWLAMHQDYSEFQVVEQLESCPTETKAGELVIKHLLAGNRGHYGPLEHPQITLSCGYFPHSLMQQLRTHRLASFDVQSFRYTSKSITRCYNEKRLIEKAFYLRPAGKYTSRRGGSYTYSPQCREHDLERLEDVVVKYLSDYEYYGSEEHARSLIAFDVRQHFVLSVNLRSLMHILDLRWKADAQIEAQWFCELLFENFQSWCPQIAEWYANKRAKKALLAP